MDVATLKLGFARRHLLEHNNGVVDAKYLAESGDKAAVGRRVRFRSTFVREFVAASMRLADELEATIPNEPARATASEGIGDDQSSAKDVPAAPPQDQLPEAPTMGIESKLEKRNSYLRALWRKSGGRTLHIDMAMDTASSVGIADETELVSVAHYLEAEGLVEIRTSGPGISITHEGVRVAERSIDPQSEEGREVELRRQDRAAFIEHAYQLVDGDEMKMFNFRDVGSALDWEEDHSMSAAEYLVDAGYLDWYTMGGNLVLTHDGIKLVEAGRKPS
jgi:hypothetical protein